MSERCELTELYEDQCAPSAIQKVIADARLSTSQWGWIAGIFEGEGSFVYRKPCPIYGHTHRLQVSLITTDRDVCERLLHWTGWGHISERHPAAQKPHWKDTWAWQISNALQAQAFGEAVLPWLLARRANQVSSSLDKYVGATGLVLL